jgi:hypothetical protein
LSAAAASGIFAHCVCWLHCRYGHCAHLCDLSKGVTGLSACVTWYCVTPAVCQPLYQGVWGVIEVASCQQRPRAVGWSEKQGQCHKHTSSRRHMLIIYMVAYVLVISTAGSMHGASNPAHHSFWRHSGRLVPTAVSQALCLLQHCRHYSA